MKPAPANVVKFRYAHPIALLIGFFTCMALAVGCWLATQSVWFAVLLVLFGICCSVGTETQINVAEASVVQTKRLFMLLLFSTETFHLSDFVAVQVQLKPASPDDYEHAGVWSVGLKPATGKVLDVFYLSEGGLQEPSEQAESQIQRLAEVTRLPIERVLET